MKRTLSVWQVLALAVVLGLSVALLWGAWQAHQRRSEALDAGLQNDQQVLAAILAGALAKPLADNEPDAARVLLEAAAGDVRVAHILVLQRNAAPGSLLKPFVEMRLPQRRQGSLRTLSRPVEFHGNQLGELQLEMDAGPNELAAREDFKNFVYGAALQLMLGLSLILLLLNRRLIGLVQQYTNRKEVEAALQHEVMEQDAIFNNALVGIEVVRDRIIVRCNRRLETLYGYAEGELAGKSTRITFPSDESYETLGKIAYADISAGRTSIGEWEMMRKDGSLIWCSYHGSAIDPLDPSKGAIWAAQDITERKRTDAALRQALLEQQIIFDNAHVGINLDKDGGIHRCNRGLEQMLGYQAGELAGKLTRVLFESDQAYDAFGRPVYQAIAAGKSWTHEWEARRKDGSTLWLSSHVSALDPLDSAQGTIWVSEDISERKRSEAAQIEAKQGLERGLAKVEQTYREATLLSELSSYLQACQSPEEAYAAISEYGPRLFPNGAGVFYLKDAGGDMLVEHACWGDPGFSGHSFPFSSCRALRQAKPYRLDVPESALCCAHVPSHQGARYPYACLPLTAQGEIFGLLFVEHRLALERDKLELRHQLATSLAEQAGLALANLRVRETLRQQSIRDPLTGLYNRRYMNETMRHELAWAQRKNSNLALAIIDVDHFKLFNDRFGHDAGDYVLQGVATALEEHVRQSDVVCRFGGEEFVVLLPGISHALAEERAGDLLAAIRSLDLQHGDRPLGRITASLGLAFFPIHGTTPETLIEAADAALYQAKEAGRNQVVLSGQRRIT